jgi:hypothetical protein
MKGTEATIIVTTVKSLMHKAIATNKEIRAIILDINYIKVV